MTSNGTFYFKTIDLACVNQYIDAFKISFSLVIARAEHAIKYGQLCVSTPSAADNIILQPGSIQVITIFRKV